jgi:glutamate transport system substrate-binding protein
VSTKYAGRITVQEKQRFSDCVNALVKGEVDAVTTDDLILAGFAAQEQYKGLLRLVGDGFTDEHYGIGLKKGSADTKPKVNAALTSFIDDGSWERSLDANVGDSGFAIPGPPAVGD